MCCRWGHFLQSGRRTGPLRYHFRRKICLDGLDVPCYLCYVTEGEQFVVDYIWLKEGWWPRDLGGRGGPRSVFVDQLGVGRADVQQGKPGLRPRKDQQ